MLVRDLLHLPVLATGRLVTQDQGMQEHEVTGVSVIEVPVGDFVRPGEVVLSTGMNIGTDTRKLTRFVTDIAHVKASLLVLAIGPYTPKIPPQVVRAANRAALPVVALPWNIRFSAVAEAIWRQLMQEREHIHSRDEFVWALASRNMTEAAAALEGRALGIDLSQRVVGIVIKRSAPTTGLALPEQSVRSVEALCAHMAAQQRWQWIGTVVGDSVIGYLQLSRSRQRLHAFLASLQSALRRSSVLSIGIGRVCEEFIDFAKSYEDARLACDLGVRARGVGAITDVSEVLADRLLFPLQRDPEAVALIERYLVPLQRERRMPLVRTLEVFFDQAGNVSATARVLSISRQALLYRLQQIESVLQIDLQKAEHRFALMFSLRLEYLRRVTEGT